MQSWTYSTHSHAYQIKALDVNTPNVTVALEFRRKNKVGWIGFGCGLVTWCMQSEWVGGGGGDGGAARLSCHGD